jgi:hypothetical protein
LVKELATAIESFNHVIKFEVYVLSSGLQITLMDMPVDQFADSGWILKRTAQLMF